MKPSQGVLITKGQANQAIKREVLIIKNESITRGVDNQGQSHNKGSVDNQGQSLHEGC